MPPMLPIDPRIAGDSWRLRRWFIPFCLVVFIGLSLACSSGSAPPATLSVQQPTITTMPNAPSTPTPTLPAGGILSHQLDQDTRALLDQVESDRLMVSIGT